MGWEKRLNRPTAADTAFAAQGASTASWYIVAASCMLIGLKYAGTADKRAQKTLEHHGDRLARALLVTGIAVADAASATPSMGVHLADLSRRTRVLRPAGPWHQERALFHGGREPTWRWPSRWSTKRLHWSWWAPEIWIHSGVFARSVSPARGASRTRRVDSCKARFRMSWVRGWGRVWDVCARARARGHSCTASWPTPVLVSTPLSTPRSGSYS